MGSVHKFKRPPKNVQQFRGYSPKPPNDPRAGRPAGWQLRNWHKSVLAWLLLLVMAAGIWGVGQFFGNG